MPTVMHDSFTKVDALSEKFYYNT